MRREIETAPKDGKPVILEDGTAASFELGRWSTKESAWVDQDGKPLAITPTHWLPLQRNAWLESYEYLTQEGSDRCDLADVSRIQADPPLADRAALECPPALEDTPTPQNEPKVIKTVEASGPVPPVWSCQAQSVDNLPQKDPEPRAPIPAIAPSGARTALERLAQEDVFARRNDITLPVIDPRTVTSQPDPLAWSSPIKGNEHLPQMEDIRGLPTAHIPAILPFPSGRGTSQGPAREDHFTPGQDFEFPRIKPRNMVSGSRLPAWGRHAFFPIAAVTLTLLLCVIYLLAPLPTYVTQSTDQREVERLDTKANILRAPSVQAQDTSSDTGGQTAKRNAVQGTTASREPKNERPPNGVGNERGEQQPSVIRSGSPASTAQSQEPDHDKTATPLQDRVATLSQDLATARLESEVQNRKALAAERDRTAALKSLELERERARVLANELATTRGRVQATAPELAKQLKPAPEAGKSELQQSGPAMLPSSRYADDPTSLGWSIYRGKEGAVVDVPLAIFVQDAGPTAKGTGRRLRSADGRSEFAAYTIREPGQTPASYLRNNLAVDPATISYKRVTNQFFALSSVYGGRIYYSRCNFYNAIHCIYLEYPESEKVAWDAIVTRVSRSLRRGS